MLSLKYQSRMRIPEQAFPKLSADPVITPREIFCSVNY